jgi:hypothetical protein
MNLAGVNRPAGHNTWVVKNPAADSVCWMYCWCLCLQVLDDFQTDPRAARKHLQNPDIHKKISKLVSAGIIQLR